MGNSTPLIIFIQMTYKLLLALVLVLGVFAQASASKADFAQSLTVLPAPIDKSGGSSSSDNQIDIDESKADSLISSLFSNNSTAARAIKDSASPAPTSAPSGAKISSTAPTAALKASVAGTSASYVGGSIIGVDYWRWGHWVRVLRCTWNNWGSGFCCNWIWVWRYW